MGEEGKIIGWAGGKILVEIPRTASCSHCRICRQGEDQSKMILELDPPGVVDIGDRVHLELEGKRVLEAAGIVYGLPILGIVGGALLGSALTAEAGSREVLTLIGSGIGLVVGLGVARLLDRIWGGKGRFEPRVVRVRRESGDEKVED
jgi:sigma-E factor negative regulatory protein RseC